MTDAEIVHEVFPPKAIDALREAVTDADDPTPDRPAPRSKSTKKDPK
jgi:hypothetical protein